MRVVTQIATITGLLIFLFLRHSDNVCIISTICTKATYLYFSSISW